MRTRAIGLAALGLVILTDLSSAQCPDPSCVPDCNLSVIPLVVSGNSTGNPILVSGATTAGYVVRGVNVFGDPLGGVPVTLNFAASPAKLGAIQGSGLTLDCNLKTVTRVSDANGEAVFGLRLGGHDDDQFSGELFVTLNTFACMQLLARSTDINGNGLTDLPDFAVFGVAFLAGGSQPTVDFNVSGGVDLGDFAVFGSEFLSGGTNTFCP